MFSVGQKVVCIADKWLDWYSKKETNGPKNGDILTVRKVMVVEGLEYLIFTGPDEAGYVSDKFRPLDYDFVERILKQVTPKPIPA